MMEAMILYATLSLEDTVNREAVALLIFDHLLEMH